VVPGLGLGSMPRSPSKIIDRRSETSRMRGH
jgi:hypothetical protein